MPAVLPIQRGVHLCNEHFTALFKDSFRQDSCLMADQAAAKFKDQRSGVVPVNLLVNDDML